MGVRAAPLPGLGLLGLVELVELLEGELPLSRARRVYYVYRVIYNFLAMAIMTRARARATVDLLSFYSPAPVRISMLSLTLPNDTLNGQTYEDGACAYTALPSHPVVGNHTTPLSTNADS